MLRNFFSHYCPQNATISILFQIWMHFEARALAATKLYKNTARGADKAKQRRKAPNMK